MKNKHIFIVLFVFILCGIAVSCSSFASKSVEDVPPIEKVIEISDADPHVLVDRAKKWVNENANAHLEGIYYNYTRTANLRILHGVITYDLTPLGKTIRRDGLTGSFKIYYKSTVSIEGNKIRIFAEIYGCTFKKSSGSVVDWRLSDDAVQIFKDHIEDFARNFEN